MLICNHERSNEILCAAVDVFISNCIFASDSGFIRIWEKLADVNFGDGGNGVVGGRDAGQKKGWI